MRKDGSSVEEASRFSFGYVAGAETTLACVTVWRGQSLCRTKFEALYYNLSAFVGSSSVGGANRQEAELLQGFPKAPSRPPPLTGARSKCCFFMSCNVKN